MFLTGQSTSLLLAAARMATYFGLPSQGWVGKASCIPNMARDSRKPGLHSQARSQIMQWALLWFALRNTSPNTHTIHSLNAFELLARS